MTSHPPALAFPRRGEQIESRRAQTPPELQHMVEDGFDRIILYDNKAISATSQKTVDGKYEVTLEVQARN